MSGLAQVVTQLAERVQAVELGKSVAWAALIQGSLFVVIYLLERRSGADAARYRTRNFANDVAYMLFYKGGFYKVMLLVVVTNLIDARYPFLQLHLLTGLPWPVGLALFWIGGDFITYWWHRLQHGNRYLWAFHSIHHSQEQMTLFTASRRHPLENLSMDVLLYFGVFHILLGIPTRGWAPLAAVITSLLAIQHSQLDWRLGPFARVLVSPRFHAFHHSAEPRHANANFGFLFSCWDYLFGTAVGEEPRPVRYGVDGLDMPESLWSQLITPFRLLRRGPQQAAVIAPPPIRAPASQSSVLD